MQRGIPDTANSTISYGHVLARQLRSAVNQIPESRRQSLLEEIQLRVAVGGFMGQPYNNKVLAYASSLLRGTCPQQPLGRQRRNGGQGGGQWQR